MERVLERLCDTRPPLCMRRFMSSEPTTDKEGWYPLSLLQHYPEGETCPNARGDLIYGHFPLDAASCAAHWIDRFPRGRVTALRQQPAALARAAAIFPVVMLRDPLERVVSFANFLNIDQPVRPQTANTPHFS